MKVAHSGECTRITLLSLLWIYLAYPVRKKNIDVQFMNMIINSYHGVKIHLFIMFLKDVKL